MPTQPSPRPADVTITSFGYLHGTPPAFAHVTIDVRYHFRDPHVRPGLRYLDATDTRVFSAVLTAPGARHLVLAVASTAAAFLGGPGTGPVAVAIGSAGGRHRGPAFAVAVSRALAERGISVAVDHRDIAKPVVDRAAGPAGSVAS
jgi:RNase adaptor protein for sRNA GlmZ degradation